VVYAELLWVLPALISNAEEQLRAAATAAEKERLERVLLILKVGAVVAFSSCACDVARSLAHGRP
jgi:hypothetical protein